MPRARLFALALLTSIIAACSSSPTSPQPARTHANEKALRDSIPCDPFSGYSNPDGRHC